MAQTITLQRGTASMTFDGTTKYTLFTQSGGIATRVMIGGVGVKASTARAGTMMGIFVQQSGGGFQTIALKIANSSANVSNLDLSPGQMNFGSPTTTGIQLSGSSLVAGNVANTFYGDQVMSSANVFGAGTSTSIYSGSQFEFCPKEFYIGPSDIVYLKAHNPFGDAGNYVYSFTCITES